MKPSLDINHTNTQFETLVLSSELTAWNHSSNTTVCAPKVGKVGGGGIASPNERTRRNREDSEYISITSDAVSDFSTDATVAAERLMRSRSNGPNEPIQIADSQFVVAGTNFTSIESQSVSQSVSPLMSTQQQRRPSSRPSTPTLNSLRYVAADQKHTQAVPGNSRGMKTVHISGVDSKLVTLEDLNDAFQLLRYDMHREVQAVIREQVRQFAIAKEDTAIAIREMSEQLKELLAANKELREENERLRHIY